MKGHNYTLQFFALFILCKEAKKNLCSLFDAKYRHNQSLHQIDFRILTISVCPFWAVQ